MTVVSVRPLPSGRRHLIALDGVRGLAVIGVLAFHLYNAVGSWTLSVTAYGALGVNLFFVLSGFLITGILLEAKDRSGYFKNFYARRALRIWPLYYGTLFVLLIALPALHSVRDEKFRFTIEHQWWLWLYLNNFFEVYSGRAMPLFGHFWSLAVEEQFYLVWPVLVLLLSPRGLLQTCLACMVIAFGFRVALLRAGVEPSLAIRVTFCEIDSLAVGAALANSLRCSSPIERFRVPGLAALALTITFTAAQVIAPSVNRVPEVIAFSTTVWSLAFGTVLVAALGCYGSRLRRLLEAAPLRFFGKYSYGIYVFHWPIGRSFVALFPSLAVTKSVAVAIGFLIAQVLTSVTVAFVSWHVFEKHFLSLKRFFERTPVAGSPG